MTRGSLKKSGRTLPVILSLVGCVLALERAPGAAAADDPQRQIALESLSRLKGADLEANPSLKAVVLRVLGQVEGTPDYVTLVRDFNLPGREPQLMAVAIRNPGTDAAADALQLLLDRNALPLVEATMTGTNAGALLQTLGGSSDPRLSAVLESLITDTSRDPALRRQAVRVLGGSRQGTRALLELLRANRLPDDLKLTARSALANARGPGVQEEINRLLPPLKGLGEENLPPIPQLVNRTGSAARGVEVFRRETVACNQCHQVNGQGTEFGPSLSEIGTKLGKDALYESILAPSAGISFGYEGWDVELSNGNELSGLIVSETENELAFKVRGGTVTSYPKRDIVKRRKMTLSIMPAELQRTMSTQDLVDLVEYLASLRKASP